MMKLEEEEGKNYISSSISGLVWIGFISLFWADVFPWNFLDIWSRDTEVSAWFVHAWPMFLWGVGLNFLFDIFRDPQSRWVRRRHVKIYTFRDIISYGFWRSMWAGVSEELAFRWILPYAAIPGLLIMNWLFFGWAGWGFNEWLHTAVWSPLANWSTFGFLEPSLMAENWVIGAAILTTNAFFRDGHKYQGYFGWVNSWFGGMYLWFIALTHGLVAAIVIHFLYDFFIYVYAAVSVSVRRRFG